MANEPNTAYDILLDEFDHDQNRRFPSLWTGNCQVSHPSWPHVVFQPGTRGPRCTEDLVSFNASMTSCQAVGRWQEARLEIAGETKLGLGLNVDMDTWWLIPLSKWVIMVITPVISGLTLLIPFITGVITHLLSGMSHQVDMGFPWPIEKIVMIYRCKTNCDFPSPPYIDR